MDTISVGDITYYLPASIAEVQMLITKARQDKTEVRIRGASHSVPGSIYPDNPSPNGQNGIFVMLSKMNKVCIDNLHKTVTVEAGCHLGYDPFDPTGNSTWCNSLFAQLDAAGYAFPDMGGIIHQTVGGFLATGSSGGSTQFSFNEQLQSITFIPANTDDPQPVTVSSTDTDTDVFYAVGVSMGLFGIIVSATFSLVQKFNITGTETITTIADSAVDMSGKGVEGKTSLQQFLLQTQYARLLWYPQPYVSKVTVWQARQMQSGEPFNRKPYQELPLIFGSNIPAELGADLVYTAIGRWPTWLADILGTNDPLYNTITQFVDKNFYNTILPVLLNVLVPLDKKDANGNPIPQTFQDYWYSSLPMDNNISDKLFPVEFTELWIPFNENDPVDKTAQVLQALNNLFTTIYNQDGGNGASGAFCTELYAAKESNFWMSPAYGSKVFRVDVFWFGNNTGSPAESYYPLFWEALQPFDFRCHWGKYMPDGASGQGVDYLKQQYPKWNDFMQLRQQFDPLQVFVNEYWRSHLGIPSL